ncbi:hypothetical protein D3C71_1591560 [compost metagenome]
MSPWFMSGAAALSWLAFLHAEAASARPPAPAPGAAQAQDAPPAARTSRRKPRIVHLPSPSEESSAQRDRRLARECRGLPNAGVCLGYAAAAARSAASRR